jgi:hypothetical protein
VRLLLKARANLPQRCGHSISPSRVSAAKTAPAKKVAAEPSVPQPAGQHAGHQHGQAAEQVEEAVRRAAQISRCGIGHHGRQQALRHAHVHAPQRHPAKAQV